MCKKKSNEEGVTIVTASDNDGVVMPVAQRQGMCAEACSLGQQDGGVPEVKQPTEPCIHGRQQSPPGSHPRLLLDTHQAHCSW